MDQDLTREQLNLVKQTLVSAGVTNKALLKDAALQNLVRSVSGIVLPVVEAVVQETPAVSSEEDEINMAAYQGVDPTPQLMDDGVSIAEVTRQQVAAYVTSVESILAGHPPGKVQKVESILRKWKRFTVLTCESPMQLPERCFVWDDVIEIDKALAMLSAKELGLRDAELKHATSAWDKAVVHKKKCGTYAKKAPEGAEQVLAALSAMMNPR